MGSQDNRKPPQAGRLELGETQNPYATHYYRPDPDQIRSARELYRLSENPYAYEYYVGAEQEAQHEVSRTGEAAPVRGGRIAKADFEARCRSIFRRYMPSGSRSALRPHHQDFIRRNSAAAPERRFALLEALSRYDLSSESGLTTYFNREEDAFTEEKLRKIEESVR
jgi:hypothetical protein